MTQIDGGLRAPSVSAVLLLDGIGETDPKRMLGPVHAWIAAAGDKLSEPEAFVDERGARNIVAQGRTMFLHAREVPEIVSHDLLRGALANPLLGVFFPTAEAVADGHSAHVVLTVGPGEYGDDDEPAEPAALGPDTMLPLLRVLKKFCGGYVQNKFPLAALWTQSGVFRGGADFAQFALQHADGPNSEVELFVDVIPYEVVDGEGRSWFGAVTNGATAVIGREVEVAPAQVALDWVLDRVLQYVASVMDAPNVKREAFRMAQDEALIVSDAPADDRFPLGRTVLTVEQAPASAMPAPATPAAPPVAVAAPPLDAHAAILPAGDPSRRSAFGRRA